MDSKIRLDKYLVEKLDVATRNLAQKLIENNSVTINNIVINKVNYLVKHNDIVMIIKQEKYVSRAAYKLLYAIEQFKIDLNNKTIVDIGSSTGGFSQVCLENNCKKIYCIDVGSNQLVDTIKKDNRVVVKEQTNFKDIDSKDFDKIDFITCDVSFISVIKILEKIKSLEWKNIKGIFLLKPQFELSRKEISEGKGKVKPIYLNKVIDNFKKYCFNNGFKIINIIESPITGAKKNNVEYLTYLEW